MKKIIKNKFLQILILILMSAGAVFLIASEVISGVAYITRSPVRIFLSPTLPNTITAKDQPDLFYMNLCWNILIVTLLIFVTFIAIIEYIRKK